MHQLLKLKQSVQLSNHGTATVDHFLGGGGQGEVYQATVNGNAMALKLYFRSEEHTSELQARSDLVCRLLFEKKKKKEEER